MVCIYCGQKTKIINSRSQKRAHGTWRRHRCTACNQLFTTQEQVDLAVSASFIAKDGSIHPFNRQHLLQSLYDSLKHRPHALTEALDLTDTVIAKLLPQIKAAGWSRQAVVQTAHQVLQNFDKAAATAYLAFHPKN